MNATTLNFKFVPKLVTKLCLIAVAGICVILFFGRAYPWLRIDPVTSVFPGFYNHISNFVITFELILLISFVWLLREVELRYFLILFGIGVALNVLVESFLSVLNTPDMVDAFYGIVAVIIAAIMTLSIKLYGITEKTGEYGVDVRD